MDVPSYESELPAISVNGDQESESTADPEQIMKDAESTLRLMISNPGLNVTVESLENLEKSLMKIPGVQCRSVLEPRISQSSGGPCGSPILSSSTSMEEES